MTHAITTAGPDTQVSIDPASVPGWGVDADPQNDPTYPYRIRANDDHAGSSWQRPPQQATLVEILTSNEHLRRPAVVGTSVPPSGVSGMVRRLAFRWTESNLLHWMLLLGADRINVVEGLLDDARQGKVPNVPAEMGARAEWEHNKAGLATKVAGAVVVAGVVGLLLHHRKAR